MWVGKLGGTQAKLNKSALKRERLKSMVKIYAIGWRPQHIDHPSFVLLKFTVLFRES